MQMSRFSRSPFRLSILYANRPNALNIFLTRFTRSCHEDASQEDVILRLAAGEMTREDFADWVERHLVAANGFIL